MYTKEKFYADFLDLREKDDLGIGLHAFFQKVRTRRSPRGLITLLDELNKEGEVVLTARVWPAVGSHVRREVIRLPLTEWLVLSPQCYRKLYFHPKNARWFDVPPNESAPAYDNFVLYVTECGLPMDVRAKVEDS